MVAKDTARVTYIDFLELLLANLPGSHYSADSASWSEAIKVLRDRYENDYPELFEDFVIFERPPLKPHSDQVSHFLTVEQEADVIEVLNPGYERLRVSREKKDILNKRNEKLLSLYQDSIQKMVEVVTPLVTVKPDTSPE
jgi:hypothetical protein